MPNTEQSAFDFEGFFTKHYDRLYGMLYQIVGTQQEAEDLAQEAFLRFHKHFPEIFPEKRKAWLFRVAVNLGYTTLQSRKRHYQYSRQVASREQERRGQAGETPERQLGIREALDTLNARQVKLLYLYASGLNYDEMAEAIGVKPSSVSQLLLRAKRAFKQSYGSLQQ